MRREKQKTLKVKNQRERGKNRKNVGKSDNKRGDDKDE